MQEKIWIVIPIMSLVFVGFVALLSLGVKVRGLNIKTVEMHNISNNTDDVFILGYSAKPKEWTIETKDSYLYGNMISLMMWNLMMWIIMAFKILDMEK